MTQTSDYVPPRVWTWDQPSGGRFANINRPVSGPTHEKELPVGKHPFQLYSLATPNGQKVSILFEELLELGHRDAEYDAWPIDINKGDDVLIFEVIQVRSALTANSNRCDVEFFARWSGAV